MTPDDCIHCCHQEAFVSWVLNACWVSKDPKDRWVCRLHSVWLVRLSYKLRVFAWLVVYQGIPSKACKLAKSGLPDGLCIVFLARRQ
jgi:hypothetical protein